MNSHFTSVVRRALTTAVVVLLLSSVDAFALAPVAAVTSPTVTPPGAASIDIRDIRGPHAIPSEWLWSAWLAGSTLLAVGTYGAWRWHRRRKLAAVKLPYELALECLEGARVLMTASTVREFSIAASEIVRQYLEDQFTVMASHRTTEEFLADLVNSRDGALKNHRALLASFLQHCDLAKFAGCSLSAQGMEAMHHSARTFVLTTGTPAETKGDAKSAQAAIEKETYAALPST